MATFNIEDALLTALSASCGIIAYHDRVHLHFSSIFDQSQVLQLLKDKTKTVSLYGGYNFRPNMNRYQYHVYDGFRIHLYQPSIQLLTKIMEVTKCRVYCNYDELAFDFLFRTPLAADQMADAMNRALVFESARVLPRAEVDTIYYNKKAAAKNIACYTRDLSKRFPLPCFHFELRFQHVANMTQLRLYLLQHLIELNPADLLYTYMTPYCIADGQKAALGNEHNILKRNKSLEQRTALLYIDRLQRDEPFFASEIYRTKQKAKNGRIIYPLRKYLSRIEIPHQLPIEFY